MTDAGGLSEAILLRLVDRLVTVEQQAATSTAAIRSMTETVGELRNSVTELSREFEEFRTVTTTARQTFEQMRAPLQRLLDLRARFTGAWLVITAIGVVIAYLFQPLLTELYRLRLGG
jgi:hypothetical protein